MHAVVAQAKADQARTEQAKVEAKAETAAARVEFTANVGVLLLTRQASVLTGMAKPFLGMLRSPSGKALALENANKLGLLRLLAKLPFQAEIERLKTVAAEAEQNAKDSRLKAQIAKYKAAVANAAVAYSELKAAMDQTEQDRRARAEGTLRLGEAIDDRRATTGRGPIRGPAWATQLLSTVTLVEELEAAISTLFPVISDVTGPEVIETLCQRLDERSAAPAAALDPRFHEPSDADRTLVKGARIHFEAKEVFGTLLPTVVEAHQGWQRLYDGLKGGVPR